MALRDTIRKWLMAGTNGNALMPPDRAGNPDMVERGFVGPPNMPKVVVEPTKQGIGPDGTRDTGHGTRADRQQARENVDIDQTAQGLSGTANLAGFVEDIGEYDPKMRGLSAIERYDKMRRTDPTVAALELAIKLPIRAADWDIQPGADDSMSKEVAAVAKENFMGGLESETASGEKHTQTFESVIENALLCAPYGCSGHEDLWTVDADKSRIRLRKLAERLPRTFYQFVTEPDGETLYQLIQFGYRGQMVEIVPVDATKMCLFTLNREGANFYGRAVNRPVYLPWYFKQNLMRIDAIGSERNRLAIPVVKQGPNASPQDVAQSWDWVENLSTNERTGLSLPYQWEAMLMGIEGRAVDLVPTIRFYDEQIVDAGLAGFLSLGKTASGARALGDTKLDFFLLSEEALARMIAQTLETTSVRRLVDHNYQFRPGRTVAYPKVICSNIPMVNVFDLLASAKDLATANVDLLQPDDDTEAWLRKKAGMPPKGKPRPRFAPIVQREELQEQGDVAIEPGEKLDKEGQKPGLGARDTGHGKPFAMSESPHRELLPHEKKHNFQGHVERADTTARQAARVLRSGMEPFVRTLAADAARRDVSEVHNASAIVPHAMASRVEKVLTVAHRYGHDQVYAERFRAIGRGKNVPPQISQITQSSEVQGRRSETAATILLSAQSAKSAANKKPVSFTVQATISDWQNELTKRVVARTLDYMRDGVEGDDLVKRVADDILTGSDGWLTRMAGEAARSAVAGGRDSAFQELDSEIDHYVRSEVMDRNTCDPCHDGDGTEWASYEAIDWQPGDDCEGGDACRGQIIPVFADEGVVILE